MAFKLFIFLISLSFTGCIFSGPTKTVETKRGRLKYVQKMEYRTGGIHGSQDWYGNGKYFLFNDKNWSPDEDFDGCEASPNEAVEAFNCYKFKDLLETSYVVRIKDEKPVTEKVFEDDSRKSGGKNLGEWLDAEGNRLIFKDFIYTIQTGEKREIKGLPDYPQEHFRAASPDPGIVVYQGACFRGFFDADEEIKKNREKICNKAAQYDQKKLEILWLIDTQTGTIKFVELSREKYDWLIWDNKKFETRRDWLNFYQSRFVWEKDKNDKFQLVAPK